MQTSILKIAAELGHIVYDKDDRNATAKAQLLGCREVTHIGNGGTHAIVATYRGTLICMIRGTEWSDLLDVERNFRVLPVPALIDHPTRTTFWQRVRGICTTGWVQAGFRSGARQIMKNNAFLHMMSRPIPVVIGGHSQGASIALILGAYIGNLRKKTNHSLPEVLGIATPPPGSFGFNRRLRKVTKSITCITNSSDPVCWVPIWFFYPKNHRVHFLTDGRVVHNIGWWEWMLDQPLGLWKFATGVLGGLMTGKSLSRSIMGKLIGRTSHLMSTYKKHIQKIEDTSCE